MLLRHVSILIITIATILALGCKTSESVSDESQLTSERRGQGESGTKVSEKAMAMLGEFTPKALNGLKYAACWLTLGSKLKDLDEIFSSDRQCHRYVC
jgi:hypothetical protein